MLFSCNTLVPLISYPVSSKKKKPMLHKNLSGELLWQHVSVVTKETHIPRHTGKKNSTSNMTALSACSVNALVLSCLASNTAEDIRLCGMCLVRSGEGRARWPLVICLQECCFHQSTSARDGSMVLMLPLTHGSGNTAKHIPPSQTFHGFWILKADVSCVFYRGICNVVFSLVTNSLFLWIAWLTG